MKCFEVQTDKVVEGLEWQEEPYPHVPVGEEGRGRGLVRFPIGKRYFSSLKAEGSERVVKADVLKTKEKGTLMLVEEQREDQRAILKLAVKAGFRGGTSWYMKSESIGCPRRGEYSATRDKCYLCGVEYKDFRHPDKGQSEWRPLEEGEQIKILATGIVAQGLAGRMGHHEEYLVIVKPKTALKVWRFGRLYGAPEELVVVWDGEELKFGTEDVVFPPSQQLEEGDLI